MKYTNTQIQTRLTELGYNLGKIDGKKGPKTIEAIKAFQRDHNMQVDGLVGPITLSGLFPTVNPKVTSKFDENSAKRLLGAHPLLQKVMNKAREKVIFQILDSQRGRKAQEKAFKEGHSKAHFGQSAHNFSPAVALDVTPLPLDWKDINSFKALSKVILATAKELNIDLEWGGDWKSFKDYPHYQLPKPWNQYGVKLLEN